MLYEAIRKKIIAIALMALLVLLAAAAFLWVYAARPASSQQEDQDESARLVIVMYHSILKSSSRANAYTITPRQFEEDLIYLKKLGCETIVVQDLIDYVYDGKPLPKRPVMLTFDDGYYNNQYYAYPLLQKHNMRAVIAVVGSFSQDSAETGDVNPNYSYLTWDQIGELSDSGVFEIQNHSYQMHRNSGSRKGCAKMSGESLSDYSASLTLDLGRLQEKLFECTGKYPAAFVYPFGRISKESLETIKEIGFFASMSSRKGVNKITRGDPDCLYLLRRNLRKPTVTSAGFFDPLLDIE